VRREKNKYVFASDYRRYGKTHRFRNTVLVLIPLLILVFFAANFTISNRIRMEDLRLTVLNLPVDLEEYSILHISDLHGARYGEKQKAIRNVLGTARYSCVVMTGDMLGKNGDVEPLLELIDLLPADERMLLTLYYFDNRPLADIAYITGIDAKALAHRLYPIRKKLHKQMRV
jgi:predicted MPP superfamily phosphohydrolase